MSHTPEPWFAEAKTVGEHTYYIVRTRGLRPTTIADCWVLGRSEAEQKANAELIAASPDLLAALTYIVAWDGDAWDGFHARELAKAAIAKAEGH